MSLDEWAEPGKALARAREPLELVESYLVSQETGVVREYRDGLIKKGKDELANRVRVLESLYEGNNAGALEVLELLKKKDAGVVAWEKYLNGLTEIQRSFAETKSDHFVVRTSTEETFLLAYALPSLENAYGRVAEFFGSSPTVTAVIEIYPTLDGFSFGSGLSPKDVERTGVVVVSRYGRIMALSPGATAFGYLWLDGLVHTYVHQNLNRISGGNCPVWLQEGTARYLEVAWRRAEGFAHSPSDRALLTRAVMSATVPSAGSLAFMDLRSPDSQEQAALVLAESADAVDFLVQEFGVDKLRVLLRAFRKSSRAAAFQDSLGMSESDFENNWRDSLADLTEVPTDLARGALGPSVRFGEKDDLILVSGEVRPWLMMGDQLNVQGKGDVAVLEYKKAIEKEPDNGVALARLARFYVSAQKNRSAEELLTRAMEKNPAYATPFILMGNIYFDDGRYEEAQQVLQQALGINPFQPKIHELLGMIAVDVGNFVLAKHSLTLALRFDPSNEAVRQALQHMPKPR
ncbi:MAG: tetratricopeptide repeat protein [Elusimicrobia bacterium]|nr:tetratricopeptide repeat protein [Elusimicrobiota bacterium]